MSVGADVSDTPQIEQLIALAESAFGPVDLYFANAGIAGAPGLDANEQDWDLSIDVNLRAHIRAATLLVPRWLERGEGYFVSTASAAGCSPRSAPPRTPSPSTRPSASPNG